MSMETIPQVTPELRRFNWRQFTRHPYLMEYQRLLWLLVAVNVGIFIWGYQNELWLDAAGLKLTVISDIALVNFTIAILIRQQRVINFLFWFATRIPTSWPLWIRWGAGKVFHFGGLHAGGNTMGTLWFVILLVGMIIDFMNGGETVSTLTLGLTALMVGILMTMIGTAFFPVRSRHHNLFEIVHRFAGWSMLLLFWAQTVSIVRDSGGSLLQTPAIWALCAISASVISPWLSLKKVPIEVVKPSNHAVSIRFNYGDTPFPGSSNSISLNPLVEWHSFANIPSPNENGYRLIISRAGDWSGSFIENPPPHVWVRGITTSGVARIELLFKKVVYVGTGSGIGPILPHLLAHDVPNKLVWATRSPRATYGDALVDEIEANTENPLIWDTDAHGKPDLSQLALQAVREIGAEAVIVISNQKLTRKVVHDMESLGIPAFGAIWDS